MPFSEQHRNQTTADRSRTLDFESKKVKQDKKAQHRITQYGWGFQMAAETSPPDEQKREKKRETKFPKFLYRRIIRER
jgi:hypothetical protein